MLKFYLFSFFIFFSQTFFSYKTQRLPSNSPSSSKDLGKKASPLKKKTVSSLTILSFNIQHARGVDKKVNLERVKKTLLASNADFIALQEVDQGSLRSNKKLQAKELARALDFNFIFLPTLSFRDGGEYGIALLWKKNKKITVSTSYKIIELPSEKAKREKRKALFLSFKIKSQKFVLINTHFSLDEEKKIKSIKKTLSEIEQSFPSHTSIISGDLNSEFGSPLVQKILAKKYHLNKNSPYFWTFPNQKPRKQIDYIAIEKSLNPREIKYTTLGDQASDHLALKAQIYY